MQLLSRPNGPVYISPGLTPRVVSMPPLRGFAFDVIPAKAGVTDVLMLRTQGCVGTVRAGIQWVWELILTVIPGLDPGIHLDFELCLSINIKFKMDCRVKPGNDGRVAMDYRV